VKRLALLLCALLLPAPAPAVGAAATTPNILIVMTDDQGTRDFMDVMGFTQSWFGGGGTEFTAAAVSEPLCCPSRASLFSGLYPHNHGITQNNGAGFNANGTIQHRLQQAGYRTAIFGKYLNGVSSSPPFFDSWATFPDSLKAYSAGSLWNVGGTTTAIPAYSSVFIGDQVHDFLVSGEAEDDQPWLVIATPPAPHQPYAAETQYATAPVPALVTNPAMTEADTSDKPSWIRRSPAPLNSFRRTYVKMERTLLSIDDMVESIQADLAALGEEQDTLAFFLSDNGYLLGEHHMVAKGLPYLPAVEVPFFMRWPGNVAAGALDARPALQLDIAATIYDAVGITATTDGQSLLGPDVGSRALSEFWPGLSDPPYSFATTITSTYQYVEWYDAQGAVAFREYYDRVADPWELSNLLVDGNPANDPNVGALGAQLQADRLCAGTTCP
jgi:arylsulfatase A-like enzyme